MTRVLIYGGRDWDDQDTMNRVLDALHAEHRFSEVINGGQASFNMKTRTFFGADWQALIWSRAHGCRETTFKALWKIEGKSAGPIRNTRMLNEGKPYLGVEFPGKRGTLDMRKKLLAAGVPVIFAKDHQAFASGHE